MTPHGDDQEYVQKWLTNCMSHSLVCLSSTRNLKNGKEREVWDCTFSMDGIRIAAILTIFKAGSLESVNTSLPPSQVAQKCSLAMTELPALGIPTPRVLGHAAIDRAAAIVCEKIERTDWTSNVRIQAAQILARIHNLQETSLSEALQELARISDPREYRTTGEQAPYQNKFGSGQAPPPEAKTLVHGDYFSANIIPVAGGLRVIDWETFGWGDPMWDLGFLIGADRDLSDDKVETVIAAYELGAATDRQRLMWHRRRWSDYWKQNKRKTKHRSTNIEKAAGKNG